MHVLAWHVDLGVSGAAALERRPALVEALGALRENGASLLVAAKRDRLARDVVAAGMIERLAEREGAAVVTADGVGAGAGPEAALMRSIVDAFAAYERAIIRARTRAALQAKRARGERAGGLRLGERVAEDGLHLEVHEGEAVAVERIRQLAAAGVPQRKIADLLDAEGHPARGGRWHRSAVQRVLARAVAALIAFVLLPIATGCSGPVPVYLSSSETHGSPIADPPPRVRDVLDDAFGFWGLEYVLVEPGSALGSYGAVDLALVDIPPSVGAPTWGNNHKPGACRRALWSSFDTRTLAHEIGHLWLGPEHSDDPENIMARGRAGARATT